MRGGKHGEKKKYEWRKPDGWRSRVEMIFEFNHSNDCFIYSSVRLETTHALSPSAARVFLKISEKHAAGSIHQDPQAPCGMVF